MSDNEKFFRNASIWGEGDVIEALAALPGYTIEAPPLIQAGRTHALRTPRGDLIHLVRDESNPEVVKTSGIDKQDKVPGGVSFQEDELVLLANAAEAANKQLKDADPDAEPRIRVHVMVSDHDIGTLK